MSAIYLLVGVSFFIAIIFLVAFFVAVKNGQFEDIHTPAMRILFDDDEVKKSK